jgi:hypothetical protein
MTRSGIGGSISKSNAPWPPPGNFLFAPAGRRAAAFAGRDPVPAGAFAAGAFAAGRFAFPGAGRAGRFVFGRAFALGRFAASERDPVDFFFALGLFDLRDFEALRDFRDDRVRAIRGPPILEDR